MQGCSSDTIKQDIDIHSSPLLRAIMLDPWETAKKLRDARLGTTPEQTARLLYEDARTEALAQGMFDFHTGRTRPPDAYEGLDTLLLAWQAAYETEHALFGEHRCLDCRLSLFASFCPIHGKRFHVVVERRIKDLSRNSRSRNAANQLLRNALTRKG